MKIGLRLFSFLGITLLFGIKSLISMPDCILLVQFESNGMQKHPFFSEYNFMANTQDTIPEYTEHLLAIVDRINKSEIQKIRHAQIPCPSFLDPESPVPEGWKPYYGASWFFHCGFRGILEERKPSIEDPMNECFYDKEGNFVGNEHIWSGCGGTPDQFDSKTQKWDHFWRDSGGIWKSGWPAFKTSVKYWIHEIK